MELKPIVTEKAVMMIESKNTITFETSKEISKDEIKNEIERLFGVKIDNIKTLIRGNKKRTYIKLKKAYPAIDIANKLGII